MALTLLLPMLACLQILPRLASPADEASLKPLLTVSPEYSTYRVGNSVIFTCLTPKGYQAMQFQFLRDGAEVDSPETQSQLPNIYNLPSLSVHDSGSYRCRYWSPGQKIPSQLSDLITLNVYDRPPPPSLSLDPPCLEYLLGEQATLSCTDPKVGEVTGYRFYNERSGEISTYDPDPSGGAKLVFLELLMPDAGPYTCKYWRAQSGQEILSVGSQPVSVSVLDPPSQPALSLDPPSCVIKEGLPLLITCTAPRGTGEQRFHFYKDGAEFISGNTLSQINTTGPGPGSMNVAVLSIPRAGPDSTGKFTCEYEEKVCRKWVPSPRSQAVTITVTDPPSQPALSLDPPSGVIKEGLPLLITCTAPRGTGEQRFHFYKDGAEFIPGNTQSQISTTGPGPGSMNVAVLSIPRAGPNITGKFTCGYEEKVCRKWVQSPRSRAVTITVTADKVFLLRYPVVGGSFFIINGLIFLISHCCL